MANTHGNSNNKPFDTRSSEWIGDMAAWKKLTADTNDDQMARLKKNLTVAIQNELTPRQQQVLSMYYSEGKTVTEIADALSVSISTVSRTLTRARARLRRALQYTF